MDRRSPEPSPKALQTLTRLLNRYRTTVAAEHETHDALCREIVKVRATEHLSARGLAAALEVSPSTVQHWTQRGRQLGA
jgi:DNA-binding transcriptional regulator YiaG